MRIRTKLGLSSTIITVVTVTFIGVTFYLIYTLNQFYQKQQSVEKITEDYFQMALLGGEYLTHPNERPKVQWISKYEEQARLLDEVAPLFVGPEERELFDDTRKVFAERNALFAEVVKNIEQGSSKVIIEELNNQITIKAQAGVSDTLRLSNLNRAYITDSEYKLGLLVVVLGILAVVISLSFYFAGVAIGKVLHTLEEDFTRIASLDFSTSTATTSLGDEIITLTRAFEIMVAKLKGSYVTLEQKVAERTKELTERSTELERLNKFMIDRELKMIELKKENKELKTRVV
ncbi:MAG: hypothetical protein HY226_02145 [Candidatus Vogelbacteria bacterium]|nr:hypothetical protein [Candidatus Vogelbacteria bacterium]